MAINGNICIFRDGSETSVSDKVEFDTSPTNGASTQPDARSHIDNFKVVLSLVAQENPNPDSDNPNSLQDTGLAIVEYEISGYFDASGGTPAAIEDIRDWMTNPKTTANVTPASTYGLILEHFEIQDDEEYTAKTAFIIRLRYNGAISGLGA
jgi:hypothetical protein